MMSGFPRASYYFALFWGCIMIVGGLAALVFAVSVIMH
jgi:hypothetical protein